MFPGQEIPDFIPATQLPAVYKQAVLSMVAHLAVQHDQNITVVGWHRSMPPHHAERSGVQLCSCGCKEGAPGTYTVITDLAYIETQANREAGKYGQWVTHIPLPDSRAAVAISADSRAW
jgi:hypothetical protein